VHIALREGDRDFFRVEALLDRLLRVEEDPPVVRGLDPGANHEVDAAIAQSESDEEKRILGRVRKKFVMVGRFDSLDIKHEMPVTIRRGNGK